MAHGTGLARSFSGRAALRRDGETVATVNAQLVTDAVTNVWDGWFWTDEVRVYDDLSAAGEWSLQLPDGETGAIAILDREQAVGAAVVFDGVGPAPF